MKIKNLIILSYVTGMTVLSSCDQTEEPIVDNNNVTVTSTQALADANQTFGWNLLKAEIDQKKDENVIISPLSVQLALYMAANGANGITEDEMLEMLQCKDCDIKSINAQAKLWTQLLSKESGHPTLSISNGFFYDDKRLKILSPGFKNDLAAYDCSFEKSDFSDETEALKQINGWVNNKTNGKIDKILEKITSDDIAFLINALYFKADWSLGFNQDWTREDDFYSSKGIKQKNLFLADDRKFPFYSDINTKVVDIPFRDSTYSLTLIRQENTKETLTIEKYHELIKKVKYERAIVTFPILIGEYENDIIASLKTFGMNQAFDPSSADFTSLGAASNRIFINQLKHKVKLEIDEKGVEGAAMTSIGFGVNSAPPYLKFDRPFYIVLRHIKTNTIIFNGLINDPAL